MEYGSIEHRYCDELRAEQVRLLHERAPLAYSVTLINGGILALVQGSQVSTAALLLWYAALASVTALRTWGRLRYLRIAPPPEATRRWCVAYMAGTALAGCVWGAAAFVMIPSPSVAHEVFVAFVLAGMSAGSVTVLAFRMEACMAFLLPALLPLIFRYLSLGTTLHLVMGVMTAIFLAGMVLSAFSFHRSVRTALILRFDKGELEAENRRRERAEQALAVERDRLKAVLSSIGEGVALIDATGCVEYLNGVAEGICGKSSGRAHGRPAGEVFDCFDLHAHQRTRTAMEESLRTGSQTTRLTGVTREDGARRVIEELATPICDRRLDVVGAVAILRDVTESLQRAEELAFAADHDALTGLPNRSLLLNRLHQAVARAQRRKERFALLFLDLDRFKQVNDSMGHAAGDAVLIEVARRLRDSVREEDTVARLGGDEFVVLLEGPTQGEQHVAAVADKIEQILREPYRLDSRSVTISVSIGLGVFPDDGCDVETLMGHADAGMYRAKRG